ncbi:hypothetical protein MFLO_06209 [Listeria floridensis FSL S10-1187]|uniref:Aminoglycoside phosphotransferase domain-containing protein n=1 Tax=Listeria floridensis FSL S10-1187 TaxID=1265817 RepID=A0ABN0RG76_9LIST|nr:phosphotransferase family protein [Listeria floridensis]EUJ32859.1 hypothetical protein MFLO_06209 [Listeria floridensis FSL S10-1187]
MWTRRVENGDVITAQKWINARVLNASEMSRDSRVAKLLSKIHHSEKLRQMLLKMGEVHLSAHDLLQKYQSDFLLKTETETFALKYLEENLTQVGSAIQVVCHGDVNHNNWMVSSDDELFLVDWDGAMLGDPAIDVAMLLYQYVPRDDWNSWLASYGESYSIELHRKLKWYALFQTLRRLSDSMLPEVEKNKAEMLLNTIVKDDEV